MSAMVDDVDLRLLSELFGDYEVGSPFQVLLFRGIRGGDRLALGFNWQSVFLLMVVFVVVVGVFHSVFAVFFALILPVSMVVFGVPTFLNIVSSEGLQGGSLKVWFVVFLSYGLFVSVWFVLAYALDLLFYILPSVLGVFLASLGFEVDFTGMLILLLGFLGLLFAVTLFFVYDWPCLYGFKSSFGRAVLDSLLVPVYVLVIIVIRGFVDLALYLFSREFYVYDFTAVRKRIKRFYDDFFYKKTGVRVCRKHVLDTREDVFHRYEEVRSNFRSQLKLRLLLAIKSSLKINKSEFFKEADTLMRKYDGKFDCLEDAESFVREYHAFLNKLNSVIEFLKKYFLVAFLVVFVVLILIPLHQISNQLGKDIYLHYLIMVSSATLYLLEVIIHRIILLGNLDKKRFPLLFILFIDKVETITLVVFLLESLIVLTYFIASLNIISLIVYSISLVIICIGYRVMINTSNKALSYSTFLYFLEISPIDLLLYDSSLKTMIQTIRNIKEIVKIKFDIM